MSNIITECPACKASLTEHSPATNDNLEYWDFACGYSLVLVDYLEGFSDYCSSHNNMEAFEVLVKTHPEMCDPYIREHFSRD